MSKLLIFPFIQNIIFIHITQKIINENKIMNKDNSPTLDKIN